MAFKVPPKSEVKNFKGACLFGWGILIWGVISANYNAFVRVKQSMSGAQL